MESTRQVVLLFDEIEAHLHPRWQRAVVPAVLEAMKELSAACQPRIQLMAATHSPLVLASLETFFKPDRDRLFHLDLRDEQVILDEEHWVNQGDVVNWLRREWYRMYQCGELNLEGLRKKAPLIAAAIENEKAGAGRRRRDPRG